MVALKMSELGEGWMMLSYWLYHGCSPILQRPLRNKLQATESYINRSSLYLFNSIQFKYFHHEYYNINTTRI